MSAVAIPSAAEITADTMTEITMESVGCPLGCNLDDETLFSGHERMHELPGEFVVVKCRECGLMRTNPRPTAGSIGTYYPSNYGPYAAEQLKSLQQRKGPRNMWRRIFRRIFEFNVNRIPPIPVGRMLEFGCAAGAYMVSVARDGWNVEGIEYSAQVAEQARSLGFSVYAGSLETAPDPAELYDMVVGWMVVEHLHDPVLALTKLRSWTKPGGWLAISVPNAGALEFRLFKDAWCALELPRHLWHFTPTSLSMLLQRGGWNMKRVHHQRIMTDAWASLGNRLQDRGYPRLVYEPLTRLFGHAGYIHYPLLPLATILAACGQTGRMTVWAQRSDD